VPNPTRWIVSSNNAQGIAGAAKADKLGGGGVALAVNAFKAASKSGKV